MRTARRSDIPRHLIPDEPEEVDSDEYVVLDAIDLTYFISFLGI